MERVRRPARIGLLTVELDSFNNYHKTHLWTSILFLPALPGEKWRGEAGDSDDPRMFRQARQWHGWRWPIATRTP